MISEIAHELGIQVNAGHGLNFENIRPFLEHVPHLEEISIGHALIAESVFKGLSAVVSDMVELIDSYND